MELVPTVEPEVVWKSALRDGGIEGELLEILKKGEVLIGKSTFFLLLPMGEWMRIVKMEPYRRAVMKVRGLFEWMEKGGVDHFTVRVKDEEGYSWPVFTWWLREGGDGLTFAKRVGERLPHLCEVMREMPVKLDTQEEVDGYYRKLWAACTRANPEQMQAFDTNDRKWKNIENGAAVGVLAYHSHLFSLLRVKPDDAVYEDMTE